MICKVNIGNYETSVTLTGANGVSKILPVRLKVTGDRPDWTVNPSDYEQSMTVVAQLQIEGLPQEDGADIIAAFIDGVCVGTAVPRYEPAYGIWFVYLQIRGNSGDNGKDISFKLWDAGTGNIYPAVEVSDSGSVVSLKYVGDALLGIPDSPLKLNARNAVEQSIDVTAGWNWVSFNLASEKLSNTNLLMSGIDKGIEIKGRSEFSRYDSDSAVWTNGSLGGDGLNGTSMYMIKMSSAGTLSVPGTPLNPDSTAIALQTGWNRIAYIPQVNQTVDESFGGAAPQTGDVIKSQTEFAVQKN